MICMGNICRSPIAEHVLRARLEAAHLSHIRVVSGGTGGWHAGEPADPRTQQILRDNGYTHAHRAQQISASWFDEHDMLIVMDDNNFEGVTRLATTSAHREKVYFLRDFDPTALRGSHVPDPYYGDYNGFEEVLDMVERACDGLVTQLLKISE